MRYLQKEKKMKINITREKLKTTKGQQSYRKMIRKQLNKFKGELAIESLVFFLISQQNKKDTNYEEN
jgi:hypothetical protein